MGVGQCVVQASLHGSSPKSSGHPCAAAVGWCAAERSMYAGVATPAIAVQQIFSAPLRALPHGKMRKAFDNSWASGRTFHCELLSLGLCRPSGRLTRLLRSLGRKSLGLVSGPAGAIGLWWRLVRDGVGAHRHHIVAAVGQQRQPRHKRAGPAHPRRLRVRPHHGIKFPSPASGCRPNTRCGRSADTGSVPGLGSNRPSHRRAVRS